MISKQDKVATRTAAGLEQKYYFGKTFAEVMGIATDAQSAASEAKETAKTTAARLTHEEIFNLLTNNRTLQGIYRGDDGELYINAEYIKSGLLYADMTKIWSEDVTNSFASFDDLNTYLSEIVIGMDVDTQKVIGAYLDFDPFYAYAVITVAVGAFANDYTDGTIKLVCGSLMSSFYHMVTMGGWDSDESVSWNGWNYVNTRPMEPRVVLDYGNGDWLVRKWSNGQCELWITVEATANLLSWGNVYYAEDVIPAQTYPVTFMNTPKVMATPKTASEYCYGLLSGTQEGTGAASPSFSIWRANAASASIPVQVDLYVKGTLA